MVLPPLAGVLFFVLAIALGLVLGSFGTVLSHRLPRGETIGGRSRCPSCGRVLTAFELIPIVSYLMLGGRCRGCGRRISAFYPLVELASAAVFAVAIIETGAAPLHTLALGMALWALMLIAVTDARTQKIPDALTGILAVAALGHRFFLDDLRIDGAFAALAVLGAQWIVSRGRWVGTGDLFLAAAIGLLVGSWAHALIALGLAYIIGAVFAAGVLLRRPVLGQRIAFGPFLALGAASVALWGDWLASVMRI
ncbi:MAG: leader peptidase (prepilin peptidase) / N-methyltransferase [Candidatus Peregrinibacteria bacterium Gr01-1014_25]|nr:MAG: leader peptidase (prepilin peptidase) / N-methyltransferase [Candidatus Peregrinibacteria bacterium Gr01-1014_25]